jgi:cell division septal protein FtsQ
MIEFKKIINRYLILYKKFIKKVVSFVALLCVIAFVVFIIIDDRSQKFIKHQYKQQKTYILKLFELSYNKINIIGVVNSDKDEIRKIVDSKTKNISFKHLGSAIIDEIRLEIEKINWVKKVFINRNISSNLDIRIVEYSPFAIWEKDKKRYIIDKEGIIIDVKNIDDFNYLIIVNGNKANLRVRSLFNIFSAKPEIGRNVYSASLVGDRRWNIRFHNNILVKLPEKNLDKAWKRLEKIYNDQNLISNIKEIDLRIENKTFLKIDDE